MDTDDDEAESGKEETDPEASRSRSRSGASDHGRGGRRSERRAAKGGKGRKKGADGGGSSEADYIITTIGPVNCQGAMMMGVAAGFVIAVTAHGADLLHLPVREAALQRRRAGAQRRGLVAHTPGPARAGAGGDSDR